MTDGQKIVFAGEGDQEPELEPGDIVIVLDEKDHPNFKRSGSDLILRMNIQLVEALCGFQKVIIMTCYYIFFSCVYNEEIVSEILHNN